MNDTLQLCRLQGDGAGVPYWCGHVFVHQAFRNVICPHKCQKSKDFVMTNFWGNVGTKKLEGARKPANPSPTLCQPFAHPSPTFRQPFANLSAKPSPSPSFHGPQVRV